MHHRFTENFDTVSSLMTDPHPSGISLEQDTLTAGKKRVTLESCRTPSSWNSEVKDHDNIVEPVQVIFPNLPRFYQIGNGPKGRGLFATQNVPPRTLIHVAPCIRIDCEEYQNWMKHTILEHYLFNTSSGCKLLALGDGSLFNHSRNPNVDYRIDHQNEVIRYSTGHAPILEGDELCIYYGHNLWFRNTDDTNEDDSSSHDEGEGFLDRINL